MKKFFRKMLGMDSINSSNSFRHYKEFDTEGSGYFCEFDYPNGSKDELKVKIDNLGVYPADSNPPGYFIFTRDSMGKENGIYIRIGEAKLDIAIYSSSDGQMRPDGLSIEKMDIVTLDASIDVVLLNKTIEHEFDGGRIGTELRLECEVLKDGESIYNKYTSLITSLDFTGSVVKFVSSKGRVYHN